MSGQTNIIIKQLKALALAPGQAPLIPNLPEKSCILETSNPLTDADSSTDTTVGWTMNTQKPKKKILKQKKLSKTEKLKNV